MQYPFKTFRLGTRYGAVGKLWKAGWHSGQDFISIADGGDGLVYPLYAGHVQKVGRSGSYGNCVYVKHADGYLTLYAHLRTVYVQPGPKVNEDTVLGVEGATGNVTGRHLHLEVHKGEYRYPAGIDPLQFIREGIAAEKEREEELEVEKQIKLRLNGVEKTVAAIEKAGHNYVRLQDLRDGHIRVDYDAKAGEPVVTVVPGESKKI